MKPTIQTIRNELSAFYSYSETEEILKRIFYSLKGLSYTDLFLNKDLPLSDPDTETIRNIILRLKQNEPLQYILGQTEFYDMTLNVNPSVLIPRPETEELVHWIVSSQPSPPSVILDLGTGSGCIALALKKSFEDSEVLGCDISGGALQLARKNGVLNRLNVSFFQADILTWELYESWPEADIVVSNPPYVTENEKSSMSARVLDFEPHSSIFVPDEDPLLFYRKIIDFASEKLPARGQLFLEINEHYPAEVEKLLWTAGFENIELRKDLQNKPRMVKGVLERTRRVSRSS
jgi:release factor glutamine methyltransferase